VCIYASVEPGNLTLNTGNLCILNANFICNSTPASPGNNFGNAISISGITQGSKSAGTRKILNITLLFILSIIIFIIIN
jgi:hypothetical protein